MLKMIFACIAFLSFPAPVFADDASFDLCLKQGQKCADVDIDHPRAEEAFRAGCDKKDYSSCNRLGQYFEVNKKALEKALKYYDIACAGKDEFACKSSYDISMQFCYVQEKKAFCGKHEPKGGYRVLVYLQTFDPKYRDSFDAGNFETRFSVEKAEKLYDRLLRSKSPKLLKALEYTQKHGHHDGADAEAIQSDIWTLKGQDHMNDGT